ncbi:hypothetical protein ACJX0J_032067, partial [Zea mays]
IYQVGQNFFAKRLVSQISVVGKHIVLDRNVWAAHFESLTTLKTIKCKEEGAELEFKHTRIPYKKSLKGLYMAKHFDITHILVSIF